MDADTLGKAEAIIENGLLHTKSVNDRGMEMLEKVDGRVIFVMEPNNGKIYIRNEPAGAPRRDEFVHANFLGGAPVRTAGEMYVRLGRITCINNESGHYQPRDVTLEWLLDSLKSEGVKLDGMKFIVRRPDGNQQVYDAAQYDSGLVPNPRGDNRAAAAEQDEQTEYDKAIGKDRVTFEIAGWPFFKPMRWDVSQARMRMIKSRLTLDIPTKIAIEYSQNGDYHAKVREKRNRTAAQERMKQILEFVGAVKVGEASEEEVKSGARNNPRHLYIVRPKLS